MSQFDIHSLIAKGKDDVRPYQLPAGEVFIRPLTELEMDEADSMMFSKIKDPATRKFIMNITPDEMEKISDENYEPEEFQNFDLGEFMRANTYFSCYIAYLAMKDFADDEFKPEDLIRVDGIHGLAEEVKRISGYNGDAEEEIENFRQD